MTEYRVPSTTKVAGMISAHADVLETHGISGGLDSARPAAGTEGKYYFSTDVGKWSRDNGATWDECEGLSEAYIQGLIDTSISTHAALPDEHHTAFVQADHDSLPNAHHDNSADHTAPTYDGGTDEIVFQI